MCLTLEITKKNQKPVLGTSLAMQGTWVRSLVREDAAEQQSPGVRQLLKPERLELLLHKRNREISLSAIEKAHARQQRPSTAMNLKKREGRTV